MSSSRILNRTVSTVKSTLINNPVTTCLSIATAAGSGLGIYRSNKLFATKIVSKEEVSEIEKVLKTVKPRS